MIRLGTREGYMAMQQFVELEVQKAARDRQPELRVRHLVWDGGSLDLITSDHVVRIHSNNCHVEVTIQHTTWPAHQPWIDIVRATIVPAVRQLGEMERAVSRRS